MDSKGPPSEQLVPSFRFGIMANTGRDTRDFGLLAIAIGDEVNKILQRVRMKSPIAALNVFPSLLEHHLFPEKISYHKRNAVISLHFNVPFSGWSDLSCLEKVDRLSTNICDNIVKIKDANMLPDDKNTLVEAVGLARINIEKEYIVNGEFEYNQKN
jgi:hypothetical protein